MALMQKIADIMNSIRFITWGLRSIKCNRQLPPLGKLLTGAALLPLLLPLLLLELELLDPEELELLELLLNVLTGLPLLLFPPLLGL
jgi:hypothetical protein